MAITTNDLKNGMVLDLDGKLVQVVEFQHVKPGKGPAFVRTKIRNVRTGGVVERTFRAGEKVERVTIDKREMQYLYRDGDDYVFMDNASYEQMNVGSSALADAASYLVDGATVDRRDYQYLYRDGDSFVFMDERDYDQLSVSETIVGDAAKYLLEQQQVQIAMYEGEPLYIEMPPSVVLEITYTEPGLQGDRSNAGTKPATVETGAEIQVRCSSTRAPA